MIISCRHVCIIEKRPCSSCKEIHELDHNAPSGEYSIKTSTGKMLKNVSMVMQLSLVAQYVLRKKN